MRTRKSRARRATAALAAATLGALALGACGEEELPITAATASLRVGIKFDQPGIGYLTAEGVPTGIDVDVAAYLAWKLGFPPSQITWVEARSGVRQDMLIAHEVDFIVASYSFTEERAQAIDFAGPYLLAGQDLLVRYDETEIHGPATLEGRSVCSVEGSTSLDRIQETYGDGVTLVSKEVYRDCVVALVAREVDAVTTDDVILAGLAASPEFFGAVRLVGKPFSVERYMIGLPPGSVDLCERINAALVTMVEDGSWARFIDRHTAGTGYTPTVYENPPPPDPCATG